MHMQYSFTFRIVLAVVIVAFQCNSSLADESKADFDEMKSNILEWMEINHTPPCDPVELIYTGSCKALGTKSANSQFYISGQAGYRDYRWYVFFADQGEMSLNLYDIDQNSMYCAVTIYPFYDTYPLIDAEGGWPSLFVSTELPEAGWYLAIVTTYGCGDNDDDQIIVSLRHPPPRYDLRVRTWDYEPDYIDGEIGTEYYLSFYLDDMGVTKIPYFSDFPSSCDCEYDLAYPVQVGVFAGPNLSRDSLHKARVSFYQELYLQNQDFVTIWIDDPLIVGEGACSELWNVYAMADPYDMFDESFEFNNCSLIAQIGWEHHINGTVNAYNWNHGYQSLEGINGIDVELCPVPNTFNNPIVVSSEHDGMAGYFEFFLPYSEVDAFSLRAYLDIPGVVTAWDYTTGYMAILESGRYNEIEHFSDFINLSPYWYISSNYDENVFNTAANGYFSLLEVNEYLSDTLNMAYTLPYIEYRITNDATSFYLEGSDIIINLSNYLDTALYYERYIIHELGHVVHHLGIPHGLYGNVDCPDIHWPGGQPEGVPCAFVEGWAEYFTAVVPYLDPRTVRGSPCRKFDFGCLDTNNIETNTWLEFWSDGEGQEDEAATAMILYDMTDYISPYGIDDGDSLAESFADIFGVVEALDTDFSIINFSRDYMTYIIYGQGGYDWEQRMAAMCALLEENKVDRMLFSSFCEPDDYICGDANGDGEVDTGDIVYIINYCFKGGPPPDPLESGDANCDGAVNVGDAVYLKVYVFENGEPPCCP